MNSNNRRWQACISRGLQRICKKVIILFQCAMYSDADNRMYVFPPPAWYSIHSGWSTNWWRCYRKHVVRCTALNILAPPSWAPGVKTAYNPRVPWSEMLIRFWSNAYVSQSGHRIPGNCQSPQTMSPLPRSFRLEGTFTFQEDDLSRYIQLVF